MKHFPFHVLFLYYDEHERWTFINNNVSVLPDDYYVYKYKAIFGKKFDIEKTLETSLG